MLPLPAPHAALLLPVFLIFPAAVGTGAAAVAKGPVLIAPLPESCCDQAVRTLAPPPWPVAGRLSAYAAGVVLMPTASFLSVLPTPLARQLPAPLWSSGRVDRLASTRPLTDICTPGYGTDGVLMAMLPSPPSLMGRNDLGTPPWSLEARGGWLRGESRA